MTRINTGIAVWALLLTLCLAFWLAVGIAIGYALQDVL